jgi:hypothetical protein
MQSQRGQKSHGAAGDALDVVQKCSGLLIIEGITIKSGSSEELFEDQCRISGVFALFSLFSHLRSNAPKARSKVIAAGQGSHMLVGRYPWTFMGG